MDIVVKNQYIGKRRLSMGEINRALCQVKFYLKHQTLNSTLRNTRLIIIIIIVLVMELLTVRGLHQRMVFAQLSWNGRCSNLSWLWMNASVFLINLRWLKCWVTLALIFCLGSFIRRSNPVSGKGKVTTTTRLYTSSNGVSGNPNNEEPK